MGILVGLPRTGGSEKDLQLNFGKVYRARRCALSALLCRSGSRSAWREKRRCRAACATR